MVVYQKESHLKDIAVAYVEDDEDVRAEIWGYIEHFSGIQFSDKIITGSILDAKNKLMNISKKIVFILDLRLGNQNPNFGGYHWLLEEMSDFLRLKPRTSIFIISGQLNPGIVESLVRRGIPENHIYDKGRWDKTRDKFLKVLTESIDDLGEIGLKNTRTYDFGETIEPYLSQSFFIEQEIGSDWSEDTIGSNSKLLPMTVSTVEKKWDYEGIPDFEVLGQIENIFSCVGSYRSIIALQKDPNVLKVEASRPITGAESSISVPFVRADKIHNHFSEKGDNAIIAIIDSGIDILHEAFRDASGNTRILAIWDQTHQSGTPPIRQKRGTEYSSDEINQFIRGTKSIPNFLRVPSECHGTHVASIAAGRATKHFSGGLAPEAKLLIVIAASDFNYENNSRFSLGYSQSHLLALEYIREKANSMGMPVVINVSQGMNAGAHDGSSNLEKGFDLITRNGQEPGIVVVKSAGNERIQKIHAKLQLMNYSQEHLQWLSKDIPRKEDAIELWFKSSDEYEFKLVPPNKVPSITIDIKTPGIIGNLSNGNQYMISYTKRVADNGDSRLSIRILADQGGIIEPGTWELIISSKGIKHGEIHAWIEKKNNRPIEFINHVDEQYTLSIPGTSYHTITVGAAFSSMPYQLAAYSSQGPTRDGRKKPDLMAPGEAINAANSHTIDNVCTMSGTSMAAPHVAGAIALVLSYIAKKEPKKSWPNAAIIKTALSDNTQSNTGNWHSGMGYGMLDVEGFFNDLI